MKKLFPWPGPMASYSSAHTCCLSAARARILYLNREWKEHRHCPVLQASQTKIPVSQQVTEASFEPLGLLEMKAKENWIPPFSLSVRKRISISLLLRSFTSDQWGILWNLVKQITVQRMSQRIVPWRRLMRKVTHLQIGLQRPFSMASNIHCWRREGRRKEGGRNKWIYIFKTYSFNMTWSYEIAFPFKINLLILRLYQMLIVKF